MSIRAELEKLDTGVMCYLYYEGKPVGVRVAMYDLGLRDYAYFDFEWMLASEKYKRTMNGNCNKIGVLRLGVYNGIVCTEDEARGKISVTELKDEYDVNTL